MKKHYYFMNKPEMVEPHNQDKKDQSSKKEGIPTYSKMNTYYHDRYKKLKNYHRENQPKYKKYRFLYLINFILLVIVFFIYIQNTTNNNKPILQTEAFFQEEGKDTKIKYNSIKYFLKKHKENDDHYHFTLVLENINNQHYNINKTFTLVYLIYTQNKEIKGKKHQIKLTERLLKTKEKINLISLKIPIKKIKRDHIKKIGINVNEEFTLYVNIDS